MSIQAEEKKIAKRKSAPKKVNEIRKPRQPRKPKTLVAAGTEEAVTVLPPQHTDDIQLLDTDTNLVLGLGDPNSFRVGLKDSKIRFIAEIHELAERIGLQADVRVYFTFKNKE